MLLRALTKTYAIPGLRLGYALCGDHDLLERMEGSGPAWPVSIPAQAAGAAALTREPDWSARGMAVIRRGRWQLADGLKRFGYQVLDSHASYLLFRAPGDQTLDRRLLERGILIRPCADYRGLGRDWYRTSVRTEAENLRLLQALEHDREGEALWPKRS